MGLGKRHKPMCTMVILVVPLRVFCCDPIIKVKGILSIYTDFPRRRNFRTFGLSTVGKADILLRNHQL
jgi:hypothetical protein